MGIDQISKLYYSHIGGSGKIRFLELSGEHVLVTGGAGFIGSHLVEKLLNEGAFVTVFDRFDDFYPGKKENLRNALNRENQFKLVTGDIQDYPALSSVVKKNALVFHLAAQAGVRYCNEFPIKANSVNVTGTLNVLIASRESGVRKLVYASSSSIYGDPVYLPLDENHPTNPNSPYGVSKLAAEQYVRVFGRVYGMDAVSLRYFSVYGPRGRPDQVVHAFAQNIVEGKQPLIFGDGNQTRDFTYVSDVIDATIFAMKKDGVSGEAFNIGHGSRITINELVTKVIARFGREGLIQPHYKEKSKGDFPDTEANNEKAKRLLGWDPKISVDEGLDHFFDWFSSDQGNKV
jgi:UDP-glucose 4-epimerase